MQLKDILLKVRADAGLSQGEMGKRLGISQEVYSKYENGKNRPSADVFHAFKKEFFIDLHLSEEAHNIITTDPSKLRLYKLSPYYPDDTWQGLPMYDVNITAGILPHLQEQHHPDPAFYLNMPAFRDCQFGARVSGNGMYPEISNGDYVICKETSMGNIIFGEIHLVATLNGTETIKYIHPHEKTDWINLVSHDKSIPVTPMQRKNIARVFKVKGVFKGY